MKYNRKEIRQVILGIMDNYEEWTFEDVLLDIQKNFDITEEELKEIMIEDLKLDII